MTGASASIAQGRTSKVKLPWSLWPSTDRTCQFTRYTPGGKGLVIGTTIAVPCIWVLPMGIRALTVTHIFLLWAKDLISLADPAALGGRARERTCSMKPVIGPRPSSGRPTLGMQFGTADLGDARRTHRLVSIMAAIARAPDESLPRQLGSLANTKAGYRLFDCGAVTRTAVMDPHVAHCRAEAARHPIVLMVHDDTILDFSPHRTLKGAGRVGNDRGTGFLAHSCLAVLPSGTTLGLAHQTIWARPPKGV